MKLIKAILIIIVLGALTPFLWVLAPFYLEEGGNHDNQS